MKKILFTLIVILPSILFSQSIVGVWSKNGESKTALEFKSDGTLNLIDIQNPQKKVLRNLTITYELKSENGITYIIQSFHKDGILLEKEEIKYKIMDGKLYLPHTSETNGKVIYNDYKDEYIRIK